MVGKFAHSFDRETFHGAEETRQESLRRAFEKVTQLDSPPEAVFVGKRVPVDPGSGGLAELVLSAMRRRMREQTGGNVAGYLMRVNEHQLAELDDQIDQVVRGWLTKHELRSTQSRIVAISEHPVPQPGMTRGGGAGGEVKDLGESEYPVVLR